MAGGTFVGTEGHRLQVAIREEAGLRAASNSSAAAAASGTVDFKMGHCKAGPMVASATFSDPDNGDTVYSDGDRVVVRFTLDTSTPPVASKWDIDKLLTFCTPCNPSCQV